MMHQPPRKPWLDGTVIIAGVCALLVLGLIAWLNRPAPSATASKPLLRAAVQSQPTPYSALDATYQALRTPAPDAQAHLSAVSELPSVTATPSPAHIRTATTSQVLQLFALNEATGQEVQLGNDTGYARLQASNDRFVVWSFGCFFCEDGEPRPTNPPAGLYVYVRSNGQQMNLNGFAADIRVTLAGDWLLYANSKIGKYQRGVRTPGYTDLYADNLETGETLMIGEKLLVNQGGMNAVPFEQLYATCGDTVAFAATQELYVFDFRTRTTQKLSIPPLGRLTELSCSDTLVVWRILTGGWWGFDRVTNTLFGIDLYQPEQRDHLRAVNPATVQGDQIRWSLTFDDQERYFGATVQR